MIVNAISQGWEVIYQQAHGILAAQLARRFKPELQCPYWLETIVAIANHDNRQKVWRGKDGLTPAGAPADFSLLPVTLEQARELMHAVRFQSQWVTLLTSMHMSFLYEGSRGEDKDTDAFLDEQLTLQSTICQRLTVSEEEAARAYAVMQWCDSLSLILCRQELPAGERALEIAQGPDGQAYFVRQLKDKTVHVEPWPFAEAQVQVQVECRILEQLQFQDDEALSQALHQAEVKRKSWTLSS
ncbi:uncharacterized protein DUF3891 [Pontibacter ummariensis]|uniref:DUF3891 domain-containing protein n=1 Tax=Pontibacter ummariensis TaxID=1610492 RepID=A0A239H4K7_9BACT|nr:DUF3891 family protein [Pontibacter ummariensis]PRY10883.1 uncharacterized protein DUF3891 [Pontibacter ummariensis]SNS76349.1 Protein of unknown function [Pontibacter ummariensis]